jgi:hypothetical protein
MIFLDNNDVISSQTNQRQTTTTLKQPDYTTTLEVTTIIPTTDQNKINGKKKQLHFLPIYKSLLTHR